MNRTHMTFTALGAAVLTALMWTAAAPADATDVGWQDAQVTRGDAGWQRADAPEQPDTGSAGQ